MNVPEKRPNQSVVRPVATTCPSQRMVTLDAFREKFTPFTPTVVWPRRPMVGFAVIEAGGLSKADQGFTFRSSDQSNCSASTTSVAGSMARLSPRRTVVWAGSTSRRYGVAVRPGAANLLSVSTRAPQSGWVTSDCAVLEKSSEYTPFFVSAVRFWS
ncbi:MAG: hypothetical protein BWY59_00026 [Verrucomicrobia bacterium ADurb.Bin345]|nr:MAG: hypothetical protein BWY59_00026 [Verrucomicrobia bacterium ADurb.Bin345]